MKRLSPEDIRIIHDYVIERYGGLAGEYEPGLIDYMADKPFDGFGGVEYYPDIYTKAAVYMEGFATHQYFCDGNKRTAYVCASLFLLMNDIELNVTDEELYEVSIAVANKKIDIYDLAEWFRDHSFDKNLIKVLIQAKNKADK